MDGLEEQTKSALELFDHSFGQSCKINVWVRIVEVFGEFGNAFSISVSFESEAFTFEEGLEFFVVGDNTVVNNSELPLWVRSRCISPAISLEGLVCSYL